MKYLNTKNKDLNGKYLNGVLYSQKVFNLYGVTVSGVFPVFTGIKVCLDASVESLYHTLGGTDYAFYHGTMKLASKKLKQLFIIRPDLKKQFNVAQLADIENEKERISGLTWHHYEELDGDRPIMQLVDEALHKACVHTGGSYTWNKKHII